MSFLGQPADWWSCLSFPSRTDAVEGREGEGTDVGAGAIQRLAVIELGYPASADATPAPHESLGASGVSFHLLLHHTGSFKPG